MGWYDVERLEGGFLACSRANYGLASWINAI